MKYLATDPVTTPPDVKGLPYLFPAPAEHQRSLLDFKAQAGGVFTEGEAAIDIMLAADRGDVRPHRYYAARWKWSASKAYRLLDDLLAEAASWRSFGASAVKHPEAEVKQRETKTRQQATEQAASEAGVKHPETEVKQYRTDPDLRPQTEKYTSAREGGGTEPPSAPDAPSLADVLARASTAGVPESTARDFFLHYEAAEWMTSGKNPQPVRNWIPKMMQWHLRQPGFAPASRTPAAPTGTMRDLTADL